MSATKTKTSRTDLGSLVKKYQRFSVVDEIEQNLLGISQTKVSIKELYLSDLFSEENYDLNCYRSLEDSLRNDGFFVPLIVVKGESGYEIINGVKRFLLAKKIGFSKLPIVQAELDEERKITYILQNIQEEEDSALVKTYAFSILKNKYGYMENSMAKLASCSVSQVKNLLRLEGLPDFLKEAIRSYEISYSEARSLLNLPVEKQRILYQKIKKGTISVRDLEKEKRSFSGNGRKTKVTQKGKKITITFQDEGEAEKNYPRVVRFFSD